MGRMVLVGLALAWGMTSGAQPHSGDIDGDNALSLAELLRVVQLYNAEGLHCETGTEDGFGPGSGGDTTCGAHASDYAPQDWSLSLGELLRAVQLYNQGNFHACTNGTEGDGWCLGASPKLYVGLMVHLEGRPTNTLIRHIGNRDAILAYADIFDEYGAKPTWEAKEQLASCIEFDDPYFLGLQARGHGVGVHADLGGSLTLPYTQEEFVTDLIFKKVQLESQGVTVRHTSGICSHLDWQAAAVDAGFQFTTGLVSYCVLSLPEELRPEAYADCTSPAICHDLFPEDMESRMHPWRGDMDNWMLHDPDGPLVNLTAAIEGLIHLVDESSEPTFTEQDVDAYFTLLDEALTLARPNEVNVFYLSWSYGSELDTTVLRSWLSRLNAYVEDGRVEWKSLPEVYDLYLTWEASQS